MSSRAPSAYAVQTAVTALAQLRERLLTADPSIVEDEQLYQDMLEGEDIDDYMAVIDRVIRSAIEANALIKAANAMQADLAERKARFTRRRDVLRQTALEAMEILGVPRIERGDFTASTTDLPPKVQITDEAALPPGYIRTHTEPDKLAIAAALKDGLDVAGAELGNGGRGLSIRTR